jgi:hypothetical protein
LRNPFKISRWNKQGLAGELLLRLLLLQRKVGIIHRGRKIRKIVVVATGGIQEVREVQVTQAEIGSPQAHRFKVGTVTEQAIPRVTVTSRGGQRSKYEAE